MLQQVVESSWNEMTNGDAREGNWRGNWRMDWVASTLHTTSEHGISSITTAEGKWEENWRMEWVASTLHTTSEHGVSSITANNKNIRKLPSSMGNRELSSKIRQFQHHFRLSFHEFIHNKTHFTLTTLFNRFFPPCSDIFKLWSKYLLKIIQSLPADPRNSAASNRLPI